MGGMGGGHFSSECVPRVKQPRRGGGGGGTASHNLGVVRSSFSPNLKAVVDYHTGRKYGLQFISFIHFLMKSVISMIINRNALFFYMNLCCIPKI